MRAEVIEFRSKWKDKQLQIATDFADYFEKAYSCSGICKSPLFYYALEVDEGRPDTECLLYLKDEIENNLSYMGITSVIAGLFMLFTFVFQYCLWVDYDPVKP